MWPASFLLGNCYLVAPIILDLRWGTMRSGDWQFLPTPCLAGRHMILWPAGCFGLETVDSMLHASRRWERKEIPDAAPQSLLHLPMRTFLALSEPKAAASDLSRRNNLIPGKQKKSALWSSCTHKWSRTSHRSLCRRGAGSFRGLIWLSGGFGSRCMIQGFAPQGCKAFRRSS